MMEIRPATPDDLSAIELIQGRSSWEPVDYLKYNGLVAVVDSVVVGFLAARETAPGEREILNLAVDSSRRRQGIARALLKHELASSRGSWFLEVRRSNAAAIRLYESVGFKVVGHRPAYYPDPPEAAIVMRFFS